MAVNDDNAQRASVIKKNAEEREDLPEADCVDTAHTKKANKNSPRTRGIRLGGMYDKLCVES